MYQGPKLQKGSSSIVVKSEYAISHLVTSQNINFDFILSPSLRHGGQKQNPLNAGCVASAIPVYSISIHVLTAAAPALARQNTTYREVKTVKFLSFQFFPKISSRGPSLPFPLSTHAVYFLIASAILEIIGNKHLHLPSPWNPYRALRALIRFWLLSKSIQFC